MLIAGLIVGVFLADFFQEVLMLVQLYIYIFKVGALILLKLQAALQFAGLKDVWLRQVKLVIFFGTRHRVAIIRL